MQATVRDNLAGKVRPFHPHNTAFQNRNQKPVQSWTKYWEND